MKHNKLLVSLVIWLFAVILCCADGSAQGRRDHLTEAENDLVRDAASPEVRIQVLVRAADRRLLALTDSPASKAHDNVDDTEKWGPFPTGSRTELLGDLVGILKEASELINGIAERDRHSNVFIKAIKALDAAAKRWQPTLAAMKAKSQGDELRLLDEALESNHAIIEAMDKVPIEGENG